MSCSRQDLNNAICDFALKEVKVSDAETCLEYLHAKGQIENGLFLQYSVDENN